MKNSPALIAAFALGAMVSGPAAAGGGSPQATFPLAAGPLAAGQVWHLTYQITGGGTGQQTLTLRGESKDSPDTEGVRSFNFSDDNIEAVAVWPGAKYVLVGLMNPQLVCAVPNHSGQRGYLIAGPEEAWEAALPYRYGHAPTDSDIYNAAKNAGLGTCTLERVR